MFKRFDFAGWCLSVPKFERAQTSKSIKMRMKSPLLLLLPLLLGFVTDAYAGSCAEMEHRYESMPSHADGLIAKRGKFSVPSQMFGRFESRACAIVSFHIDGSGGAYDIRAASYHPSQGIGRAAMEALKGYEFTPGNYGNKLFVLMLKYNRFELK